jgi:serine/threonine protein kinase
MSSARVAPANPPGPAADPPDAARVQAAADENVLPPHATADQCLAAGARIGEYHVVRVLHADESGVAYLARDLLLQRDTVVLEHLPAALAHRNGSGQVVLRAAGDANAFLASQRGFIERAQRQARFDHPSTLPLWRCWYGNGTAYAAMPYHGGVTLADARRAMSHPPEESWLRAVILPLLDAIESLHALPVLHLGISPNRVALRPDGRPVLLDPGAQLAVPGAAGPAATYQPPELREPADHLPLGAWTDLYALAATLFHAITGHAPAPSGMPTAPGPATGAGPLASALVALRAQWPRLNYSPGLVRAIDQGLAASPADRPQSVAQFRRALKPVEAATNARPIAEDPAYLTAPMSASARSASAPLATMPSAPAQELPVLTDTSTHGPDKPPQWIGPNNEAIAADIERTLGMVAAHAARDAANLRAAALAGERRPLGERMQRRSLLRPLLLLVLGGLLAAGAYLWQDPGEAGQSLRGAIEDLHAKVGAWRDAYDPFATVSPAVPTPRPALPDGGAMPQSAPIDPGSPAPSGMQLGAPSVPQMPSPALPQAGVQADALLKPRSDGRADANAGAATTTEPPSSSTVKAATLPESPRAACGGRTNFSLLYCMEQQCERAQFADHPQCVRLRATGEVE